MSQRPGGRIEIDEAPAAVTAGGRAAAGFQHEALFYEDHEAFVAGTLPFIREGVERRAPVMVAVDQPKIRLLEERLGPDAGRVQFKDMRAVGTNPGAIISVWREFAAEHGGDGGGLWGIGEPVWDGRSTAELAECHRHECLLNLAFADAPDFRLLCPYDAAVRPLVHEDVHVSHPVVGARASARYGAEDRIRALFAEPLPEPPAAVRERRFDDDGLAGLRRIVVEDAAAGGLSGRRVEDAVLAVNELATNSVAYGGGGGTLRHWRDGDVAVWEVRDRGSILNPLVGRQRPSEGMRGGFGLWIVNQLCDLVQLRSSERGTTVRIHLRG